MLFSALTPVWTSALLNLSVTIASVPPTVPMDDFHAYRQPLPTMQDLKEGVANSSANLSPGQCRRELRRLGSLAQAFQAANPTRGVANALHITKPLAGLEIRGPSTRVSFSTLDCRQALVWAHLVPLLQEHEVASVHVGNFYRKGARLPKKHSHKSQHAYGLATDISGFTLTDGRYLGVKSHFFGQRGEPACGPSAAIHPPESADLDAIDRSIRMRNLVCDLARSGALHHILTPNYDKAHEDHLHVDIKRDNDWFLVR